MLRLCPARALFSFARLCSKRRSGVCSGEACLVDFPSPSPAGVETTLAPGATGGLMVELTAPSDAPPCVCTTALFSCDSIRPSFYWILPPAFTPAGAILCQAGVLRNNRHADLSIFDRLRLLSRTCSGVKAHPQVPHLHDDSLASDTGPPFTPGDRLGRTASTNSPSHSGH